MGGSEFLLTTREESLFYAEFVGGPHDGLREPFMLEEPHARVRFTSGEMYILEHQTKVGVVHLAIYRYLPVK